MESPSNNQRAARQAAQCIEQLIVEMLDARQVGEVAVIVGFTQLEPEKRCFERKKTIRVARGQTVALEQINA